MFFAEFCMWTPKRAAFVLSAGLTMLAPGCLIAQRIAGTVWDSIGLEPIPGAVVTVIDSAGQVSRQLLTDAHGRFTIVGSQPWARVRVIRIGFKPVVVARSPAVRAEMNIRMAPITIALETVRTTAGAICGPKDAGGNPAAALWEQARAALLASMVARRAIPATATVVTYHQVFDSAGTRLMSQRIRHESGLQQRPFGAVASAAELARSGYVVDLDGAREYRAPDADVLLDPQFARTHCFGVTLDARDHRDEAGLTFQPASNASNGIVDVAGIIWIDAGHPELRTMSFHYTNIEPSADRAGAGGELRFTTMANGVVALTRWSLTAPVVVEQRVHWQGTPLGRRDRVTQVDRIGGVLARASWPDGVTWHGAVGAVVGRVVRRPHEEPAAGVRAWLETTDDTATTDTTGTFRLRAVLPGRYTLHVWDPVLAPFDIDRGIDRDFTVHEGENAVGSLALTAYSDIERSVCGDVDQTPNSEVLFVQLSTPTGPPEWPAQVAVTWPQVGTSAEAHQRLEPKSYGRFHVCGAPQRRVVSIRVQRDTVVWLDTVVVTPAAHVGVMTFHLRPAGHR